MTEQQTKLVELTEKIQGKDTNITLHHYTPLQLVSRDAYLFFEDETAGKIVYQGKIWSQKIINENGMIELLLMQEKKSDGTFGTWSPFVYRAIDPDISAAAIFDQVPRVAVDPSVRGRLNRFVNAISWTLILILLWIIVGEVQVDTTIQFFLMMFGFAMAIGSVLYYERKRLLEDLVHTATIFPEAPKVSLSRSFVHPISGDIFRFAGEVVPIMIKSSKVSFAKIRGFSVTQVSQKVEYSSEIRTLKVELYKLGIQFPEGGDSKDEKLKDAYFEAYGPISDLRNRILQAHSNLINSSELDEIITAALKDLSDGTLQEHIKNEIEYQEFEFKSMQSRVSQLEIERDKYAKDAQRWMKKANSDMNNSDLIIAVQLAQHLRDGAMVDVYSPDDLPNQGLGPNISGLNGVMISALVSLLPFVLIFTAGMLIYNAIKDALSNLGEWASFLLVLIIIAFAIGAAVFTFGYVKNRLRDSMRNTTSSQKTVMG